MTDQEDTDTGGDKGLQDVIPKVPRVWCTTLLLRMGALVNRSARLSTVLLTALIEESGHGYALIEQRVQQLVGDQVYVDPGSVYRILRLLEESGMVSSTW